MNFDIFHHIFHEFSMVIILNSRYTFHDTIQKLIQNCVKWLLFIPKSIPYFVNDDDDDDIMKMMY